MSDDPYAAPSADLDTSGSSAAIKTSAWSSKGRLSLLSFWGQSALLYLLVVVLVLMAMFGPEGTSASIGSLTSGDPTLFIATLSSGVEGIVALVAIVLYLLLILFAVNMLIKRLHDRNHSGFWILLCLIPLLGIIPMLYLGTVPGNKTENNYGGPRATQGWEKVIGVIFLLLLIIGSGFAIMHMLQRGAL